MSHAGALPTWVAVLVALLVVLGAAVALIGSVGLLRLGSFYERIHPPTMGTTLGLGFTLIASMALFSALESRPVLHEIVIGVFTIVTTPVTFMVLLRAAVLRDRAARDDRAGERGKADSAGASPRE